MDEAMYSLALTRARFHLQQARESLFNDLSSAHPSAGLDACLQSAGRAMHLLFSSEQLVEKIWAGSIPYEKAGNALAAQFPEFPEGDVQSTLSAACIRAR